MGGDLGELCLRGRIKDQTKLWGFGPEVRVWARTDLKARNLKTSGGGGPRWKSVLSRMSVDREEGRVIEVRNPRCNPDEFLNRELSGAIGVCGDQLVDLRRINKGIVALELAIRSPDDGVPVSIDHAPIIISGTCCKSRLHHLSGLASARV